MSELRSYYPEIEPMRRACWMLATATASIGSGLAPRVQSRRLPAWRPRRRLQPEPAPRLRSGSLRRAAVRPARLRALHTACLAGGQLYDLASGRDIERLREMLGVDKWMVFGGSGDRRWRLLFGDASHVSRDCGARIYTLTGRSLTGTTSSASRKCIPTAGRSSSSLCQRMSATR